MLDAELGKRPTDLGKLGLIDLGAGLRGRSPRAGLRGCFACPPPRPERPRLCYLQDRLVKELKLAGITTIEAAKRFIREFYPPDHNGRFARPPEAPESAFVPAALEQVQDILCRQEHRTVGNDNTVRYRGLSLQIPPSPIRPWTSRADHATVLEA